jgi:hypothetical protein
MDPQAAAALAQFGTAGLIGWMWLTERRAAAIRERQLAETHDRLMAERACFDLLVAAIKENTRTLATLEAGQRAMTSALHRLMDKHPVAAAG